MHHTDRAGDNTPDSPSPSRGVVGLRRATLSAISRILNPPMRRLAGSRALPLFAVVQHRGRRSGRIYATPVAAKRTTDGFVVPMTFGEQADWFRNVQAAGGCVIRWNGAEYPVAAPEIIDLATARSAFRPFERVMLPVIGITQFVHLRSDAASAIGPRQEPESASA